MFTFLFLILMCGIVGNLLGLALKMSWGLIKILFVVVFWPVILLGLVFLGLLHIAFPILIVIGIVSLLTRTWVEPLE